MVFEKKLHLVVIGAHIGDAEVTAGGVVCKYTQAGHKATFIHLTAGERGNPKMNPAEYKKQRLDEARRSAKKMGAEVIVFDYPDGELPVNDEVKLKICDAIRKIKPDLVITHWHGSFHRDHRNCHINTMEGVFWAALPGIVRELPAHCIPALYYAENWEDPYDYHPDFWIDISGVYDQWMDALKEHALFRGEVASFDYLQYYSGLTAMRGAEVGYKRAQTFALPPISRKRGLPFFPTDEPVLIF
ncbi:MAG: PIG-L family deacetylase [candidate division KSB1 bacterium]|nr:PIG-L family deacetylase [candidate division KSB1 bacterium]MDZ7304883.1 PIG-L family deacetylase [candidate division KSB1 bacterium]MDZ7314367.1 PIG-L family deacetylase [candidate division KSB1 bacterium]